MTINQFTREHVVMGSRWQWVGYPQDDGRSVTLVSAYKVEGVSDWVYMPGVTLTVREAESQEDRFNEFVDNFLQHSKEGSDGTPE